MFIGYLVGDKLKKCVEKVAVFDLDGTLYHKNSHIEILNYYYNTSFFTSILFRIFSFFEHCLAIMWVGSFIWWATNSCGRIISY